jgi:aspartate carbamoyltransferase catalytic subunit
MRIFDNRNVPLEPPVEGTAGEVRRDGWRHRHLLDADVLRSPELDTIMRTSDAMEGVISRPIPKATVLRGQRVTTLFYGASMRTRVSFEEATQSLPADVVSISTGTLSVTEGGVALDTIRTIEALGADVLVMWHSVTGAPYLAAEVFGGHVLNGGDA